MGGSQELLRGVVKCGKNVLVVGDMGSGKMTLLNTLLREMSVLCASERMVLIENTPEIKLCNR